LAGNEEAMPKIWGKEERAEIIEARALVDPLSEETRKERRALLAVSVTQLVVAVGGVIPSKIDALGVELSAGDTGRLLGVLCAVQIYLLVAFWIYSTADLKAWAMDRERIFSSGAARLATQHTNVAPEPDQDPEEFEVWLGGKYAEFTRLFRAEIDQHFRVLSARAVLERWVPIAIGAGSLVASVARIAMLL
jgi:hypothetical protein